MLKTGNNQNVHQCGMDKLVYSYNGILINNKKEWTMATHNKIDESQTHVEWKLSDTKDYILLLYDVQE